MKLCSACLLGIRCRYDGKSKPDRKVIELLKTETLIPVCPEQLGGLPVPRGPFELTGDGSAVLEGRAKVINRSREDFSNQFIKGAEEVLNIARLFNITEAIFKQRSPSCGCGIIYDCTFSKQTTKGDGVTTALLKKNNIKVISEEDI